MAPPVAKWLALALLSAPGAAGGGVQPRYGGDLRVALTASPAELDPARATSPSDLAAVRALHATLVETDASGALRPGLLETLPEAEPDRRAFRMRLRSGLRFHDGSPVTAADVAASLTRLLEPAVRSPHGWIALAIEGAEAVREGKAAALAGLQILSETELRVVLDVPFPDFPRALAAAPAAIVPRGVPQGVGAGPFRLATRPGGTARLTAFEGHHRGRPYLDAVSLAGMESRRAARGFTRGEIDLALRPEALAEGSRELPALTAAYVVVNARSLGAEAEPIRRALGAVDRAELVRLYVRGPAAPLTDLLPPPVSAGDEPPPYDARSAEAAPTSTQTSTPTRNPTTGPAAAPSARFARGPRLVLLVPTGPEPLRPVADRLQVKLFDRGLRTAVEPLTPEALAARLASSDFDLALVSVTFVATSPPLATLEVTWALGGPAAARRALARLAPGDRSAAPPALDHDLGAVPLFATGLRASARPELQGLAVAPDGGIDLGDAWLLPARRSR